MKWLNRIMLALLAASVIGMAVSSIIKARTAVRETDLMIERIDAELEAGRAGRRP